MMRLSGLPYSGIFTQENCGLSFSTLSQLVSLTFLLWPSSKAVGGVSHFGEFSLLSVFYSSRPTSRQKLYSVIAVRNSL